MQPLLNQLKVPGLFAGTGASAFDNFKQYPWTMGYLPSFSAEGAIYGRQIAATKPKAKIGVLYENSDFGDDLVAGLKKGLAGKAKIVAALGYEPTDSDVASQVSRLKAAGADTFMIFATPLFAIKAYIDMHKLGWKPQVYVSSVSIEPTHHADRHREHEPRDDRRLDLDRLRQGSDAAPLGEGPATKLYRQIMAKYDPTGRPTDVYNFYGMAVAFTMVDVLKKAGRNLTRESLLQAATHLNEANNPFLLPGIVLRTSPDRLFPDGPGRALPLHQGPLDPARARSFPPRPSALLPTTNPERSSMRKPSLTAALVATGTDLPRDCGLCARRLRTDVSPASRSARRRRSTSRPPRPTTRPRSIDLLLAGRSNAHARSGHDDRHRHRTGQRQGDLARRDPPARRQRDRRRPHEHDARRDRRRLHGHGHARSGLEPLAHAPRARR